MVIEFNEKENERFIYDINHAYIKELNEKGKRDKSQHVYLFI